MVQRRFGKYGELDAAVERATLRRERMQLLDRLGPATDLIAAARAAAERGDTAALREQLERAEKILQIVLDETSDRVMVEDASEERAERLARQAPDEERFND